jgi:LacI family transcriptional regulator
MQTDDAIVEALAERSLPFILTGRHPAREALNFVDVENRAGARAAVRHLLACGYRRIAAIHGPQTMIAGLDRCLGYQDALREAGLPLESDLCVESDFSEAGGYNAVDELLTLDPRPTAIFAANDLSCAGALDRIEDAGLQVPSEMSIVGYNNTGLAAMHHLSLTTINQPRGEFGRIAAELILERLDGGRSTAVHHVVAPTLVVRRTTGPLAAAANEREIAS